MLFSSTIFIFFFLPLVTAVYYGLLRKSRPLQNGFLFIASLFFYAWGEPKFVLIMLTSIVANWGFGLAVDRFRGKKAAARAVVAAAAAFNLGIMFIFKYLMFTIDNANKLFGSDIALPDNGFFEFFAQRDLSTGLLSITLPIGISFFTFQALSYVIDVYRGQGEVQENPIYVGLYIALFPQLIAGPIVRYTTVAEEISHRRETLSDFCSGVTRFLVGLNKKVLLANNMAVIADLAFDSKEPISAAFAWLGALAYAFQIYFDFSGYSDMAIGLGRMFGFHFLENFDYPYISSSVSEFWRRWHISLGSWFRDYVYFPLGGSRVRSKARLVFNLFAVWILTGVWHGANWTFILWGALYFVLITVEKLTGLEKKNRIKPLGVFYTLFFVLMGWVLFRAESLGAAGEYFKAMFGVGVPLIDNAFKFNFSNNAVFICAAVIFSMPTAKMIGKKLKNRQNPAWDILYALGLLALTFVSCLYIIRGSYNPFIYFNF